MTSLAVNKYQYKYVCVYVCVCVCAHVWVHIHVPREKINSSTLCTIMYSEGQRTHSLDICRGPRSCCIDDSRKPSGLLSGVICFCNSNLRLGKIAQPHKIHFNTGTLKMSRIPTDNSKSARYNSKFTVLNQSSSVCASRILAS